MKIFRLIPADWRDSVQRDLEEEASRSGWRGMRRTLWISWQVLRVAGRFHWRAHGLSRPASGSRRFSSGFSTDLRLGLRAFRRQPGSSAAIVVMLALGIGATTAGYALFNYVLFRPVPGVVDPARLVTIYFQPIDDRLVFGAAPRSSLAALRQAQALDGLGGAYTTELPVALRADGDAEHATVELVTDGYLGVLGVRARTGRLFTDAEIGSGADVALISERLWHRAFGGASSAIGQRITVTRIPFTVVGIVDRYQGWGSVRAGDVDVWLPMTAEQRLNRVEDRFENLVGRLPRGGTAAIVEQQLRAAFTSVGPTRLFMTQPGARPLGGPLKFAPTLYNGLHESDLFATRDRILEVYPFVIGPTVLLLLLACANAANLLLARTLQRGRELAVKSAIGAGGWRLVRGVAVEVGILGMAAMLFGVLAAKLLTGLVNGTQVFSWVAPIDHVPLDWRVLLFTAGMSMATVVVFGFVPILAVRRARLRPVLHQAGRFTNATSRFRAVLLGVQIALSLTLLAGAGVLARSLHNLRAVDLGMNARGVVSFGIDGRRFGLTLARRDALVREVLGRLSSTPGVQAAAVAAPPAFWKDGSFPARVRPASATAPDVGVETAVVSGSYFDVLGIPVRAGRTFSDDEFQRPPGETGGLGMISESLARQLFGGAPAVGQHIEVGQAREGEWRALRRVEVIGVVGDTRSGRRFRTDERPALYEPAAARLTISTFYVRSSLPAAAVIATMRNVVRQIEPGLPLTNAGTLRDEVERLIPEERVLAQVLAGVALVATVLAIAGIYAVVTYLVNERTREFGIRIALGASGRAISIHVLRAVAITGGAGLAAGLVLFAGASRLLEARVFGVSALDPATLAVAMTLLILTAFLAAWCPTRRAARVDPTIALRAE
jgi:predicted permease